ncbi:MAG: hypothetical protein U0U66_04075 [Cytophagaceae bacterium]
MKAQVPDITVTKSFIDYIGILADCDDVSKNRPPEGCDKCYYQGKLEIQNNTNDYIVLSYGFDLIIDSCIKIDKKGSGGEEVIYNSFWYEGNYLAPYEKTILYVTNMDFCKLKNECLNQSIKVADFLNDKKLNFRLSFSYLKMKKIIELEGNKDSLEHLLKTYSSQQYKYEVVKRLDRTNHILNQFYRGRYSKYSIFYIDSIKYKFVSDTLTWEHSYINNYSNDQLQIRKTGRATLPQSKDISVSFDLRLNPIEPRGGHYATYQLYGTLQIKNTSNTPIIFKAGPYFVYTVKDTISRMTGLSGLKNPTAHFYNTYIPPGKTGNVYIDVTYDVLLGSIPPNERGSYDYIINNFINKTDVILQFCEKIKPVNYTIEIDSWFFKNDSEGIKNIRIPIDTRPSYIYEAYRECMYIIYK